MQTLEAVGRGCRRAKLLKGVERIAVLLAGMSGRSWKATGGLVFVRYPVGLYFGLCTSAGLTSARDKNRMHRQVFATAIHNGNDRSCSNPPLKSLLTFSAGPRSVVAGRSLQHRQVAATGYAIKLPVHVASRPGVSSSTSCLHDGRATSQIPVAAWQQLEGSSCCQAAIGIWMQSPMLRSWPRSPALGL